MKTCSPQSCRRLMTVMGRSLLDSVVTEGDGLQACVTAGFPTRLQSRTCAARAASSRKPAGAATLVATRPRRNLVPRWLPRRPPAAEVLPRLAPGPMATSCGADVCWRWGGRIRFWLILLAAQSRGAVAAAAVAVSSAFPDAFQPVLPLQWIVHRSGSATDSCVPQDREYFSSAYCPVMQSHRQIVDHVNAHDRGTIEVNKTTFLTRKVGSGTSRARVASLYPLVVLLQNMQLCHVTGLPSVLTIEAAAGCKAPAQRDVTLLTNTERSASHEHSVRKSRAGSRGKYGSTIVTPAFHTADRSASTTGPQINQKCRLTDIYLRNSEPRGCCSHGVILKQAQAPC